MFRPWQLIAPGAQSAAKLKVSPITFPPKTPGYWIDPSRGDTKAAPPLPGSMFGRLQGFTQRRCTGIVLAPTLADYEELNAPAVAVAVVVVLEKLPFEINLKMRAK